MILNHPDLLHDVQGVVRRRSDDAMVINSVWMLMMMILRRRRREADCILKYDMQRILDGRVVVDVAIIRRLFCSFHHHRIFPNDVLLRVALLLWW